METRVTDRRLARRAAVAAIRRVAITARRAILAATGLRNARSAQVARHTATTVSVRRSRPRRGNARNPMPLRAKRAGVIPSRFSKSPRAAERTILADAKSRHPLVLPDFIVSNARQVAARGSHEALIADQGLGCVPVRWAHRLADESFLELGEELVASAVALPAVSAEGFVDGDGTGRAGGGLRFSKRRGSRLRSRLSVMSEESDTSSDIDS